jgi:hypothetical protein
MDREELSAAKEAHSAPCYLPEEVIQPLPLSPHHGLLYVGSDIFGISVI